MVQGCCDYHLCRKQTEVKRCPYCNNFFCNKHFKPKEPGNYHPGKDKALWIERGKDNENAHPCPPYVDYLDEQKKIRDEKWGDTLDKLSGRKLRRGKDIEYHSQRNLKTRNEVKEVYSQAYKHHDLNEAESSRRQNEPYLYEYIPSKEKESEQKQKKDPIQSEDIKNIHHQQIKKETGDKKKAIKRDNKIKTFTIVASFFIIIILIIILAAFQNVDTSSYRNVTKIKNVTYEENVTNKLSYVSYLQAGSSLKKQRAVINGSLRYRYEGNSYSGIYFFTAVDDDNNEIRLYGLNEELRATQKEVGKSKELYSFNGYFNSEYGTFVFRVESISPYQRQIIKKINITKEINYQEQVIEQRSKPKYPFLRNIVFKIFNKEVICEDRTLLNNCSIEKPLMCSLNGLIEAPSKCGCPTGERFYENRCVLEVKCSDGTLEPDCSEEMNMQCIKGEFVYNPKKCGCPDGDVIRSDTCVKTCNDGTAYDECSDNKPKFCDDGYLTNKASVCGCPTEYIVNGELCTSKYQTGPKTIKLQYIVDGKEQYIDFVVYRGLNDYLSSISRSISYYSTPPSKKDFVLKNIDNNVQKEFIIPLIDEIKSTTSDKNQQAKIAISIVQKIPYDWDGYTSGNLNGRYAYEVLYDTKGVCGEKSELLALILRELGFGVVLFNYEAESHQALGIKCPSEYDYQDSGYCFVETASPSIITEVPSTYVGVGELKSTPETIVISEGYSLDDVKQEYSDAILFERISDMGPVLDQYYYSQWWSIVNKYGIEIDTN